LGTVIPGQRVSAETGIFRDKLDQESGLDASHRPGMTSSFSYFFVLPESLTASKVWNSTL
jgi:hypothetical protein